MADTDLRDQLHRLANVGSGGVMPVPAAEVRRRGRARTRRRVAAVATTLGTAAVLTGVVVTGIDSAADRPLAAAPAATAPGPAAGTDPAAGGPAISEPAPDTGPPVDPAVLLTVADLPDPADEPYGWGEVEFRTDTPEQSLPCALGVTAVLDENLPGLTRAFEAAGGGAGLVEEVRRYPAEASTADAVASALVRFDSCGPSDLDTVNVLNRSSYGFAAHIDRLVQGEKTSVDLVVAGRGTTVVALYARGRGEQPGQQVLADLITTALDRAAG